MKIYFDWELDDNAEQPKDPNNFVYKELREFLKSRYSLLEEDIDSTVTEGEVAFIGVIWHRDGVLELRPVNIHERFRLKLEDCISESDIAYIMAKIGRLIEDDKKNG